MKIPPPPEWDLTPKEAAALQRSLSRKVIASNRPESIRTIAGADIATAKDSAFGYAGVGVLTYPGLMILERASARLSKSGTHAIGGSVCGEG